MNELHRLCCWVWRGFAACEGAWHTSLCFFFCCYRGGGLGEWRGHFGRAVIWLLLSVCHPFCLQAKPTGDERLHFSPPCQCCDWLKGVRLSWLPISVCWLGVAGFCWKVQFFFFFFFSSFGEGANTIAGVHTNTLTKDVWGSTGYYETWSHAEVSPTSLQRWFNDSQQHVWQRRRLLYYFSYLQVWSFLSSFFLFLFFFWLATADKLQWVGWNLICDNFGFTVM